LTECQIYDTIYQKMSKICQNYDTIYRKSHKCQKFEKNVKMSKM